MLPIKPERPIKYGERSRMPSPEMIEAFFESFNPEESKYKLLFALQLATGLRIGECTAISIIDFSYNEDYAGLQWEQLQKLRHDYMGLHQFINELMTNDLTKFRVLLQKKQKENCIVDMDLPVSVASILKEYVLKNLNWIMRMGGFIFCKNNNRQPLHITPAHAIDFLAKKRTYLDIKHPEMGFKEVLAVVNYDKDHGWGKARQQRLYRFGTHSFRKFHALYGYIFEGKDPIFAKQLLHHNKMQTTEQHYISHFNFKEKRQNFQNKVFGKAFHELLREEDSKAIAVWSEIKTH